MRMLLASASKRVRFIAEYENEESFEWDSDDDYFRAIEKLPQLLKDMLDNDPDPFIEAERVASPYDVAFFPIIRVD